MKLMSGTSQRGVQLPSESIHLKTAEMPDGNSSYHILIHSALAHSFPVTSNPLYTCIYYEKETVSPSQRKYLQQLLNSRGRKAQQHQLLLFLLSLAVFDPK